VTALALAAVLSLAVDAHCGAAAPRSEFAQRITAIAIRESGGDPLVIGVNADPSRGLPAAMLRAGTAQDAARQARMLLAQGRSIDLGLMQINSSQLARHGLTVDAAFDACRNMAAGAEHYAADVAAVWNLAARRYNTGGIERGAAYAASVEHVLARVREAPQAQAAALPSPPPDPPCAPAWDSWALAACSHPSSPLEPHK
jgi:type IV secretion system protein VirB1